MSNVFRFAFVSLFIFNLSVSNARAASAEFHFPEPKVEKLSNGLEVVWFQSDRLPLIDLMVMTRAGYAKDPLGKSGTSELLAATLDRGAHGLNARQLGVKLDRLGAAHSISTDDDGFTIGVHGMSEDAPELLDYLSKVTLHPDFPADEIKREHERLLDRWRHLGDSTDAIASLALHRILAANTPYGRGSLLSAKEFQKVSRSDVLEFYNRYFTPENSLLVVVGKVPSEKFREQIVNTFTSWKPASKSLDHSSMLSKAPPSHFTDSRIQLKKGYSILVVHRPGLNQAQIRMGFIAPPLQVPDHHAWVVANALIGEYFYSRLNAILRDRLGLTYGVSSGLTFQKELNRFSLQSSTQNKNVGELYKRTFDILVDLKKNGASDSEVALARDYRVGGFPLSLSTLHSIASRWLGLKLFGLSIDYLKEFPEKVEKVQTAEVSQALSKYLDMDHLVTVIAGDAPAIEASLKKSGIGNFKRVEVKDLE